MPSLEPAPASRARPRGNLLFRFRDRDSRHGVSRATAAALSEQLGLSETQVIHLALAELARRELPAYDADEGAVSQGVLRSIAKRVPQGRMKVSAALF